MGRKNPQSYFGTRISYVQLLSSFLLCALLMVWRSTRTMRRAGVKEVRLAVRVLWKGEAILLGRVRRSAAILRMKIKRDRHLSLSRPIPSKIPHTPQEKTAAHFISQHLSQETGPRGLLPQ